MVVVVLYVFVCVALWSSGRHSNLGSDGPGFESLFDQVDAESLGKALYMQFLTRYKNVYFAIGSERSCQYLE